MNRRHFLHCAAAATVALPLAARHAWAVKAEQGLFVHPAPRPVPTLDIRDGESRPVGLETLRGRAVVLNLWASWCLPCVAELPALDRLKPLAEPEGIAVVALCLDRSGGIGAVNTYARLGIRNLDVRVDHQRQAGAVLAAAVLPTTLLIDANGAEAARFVGAAAWDGPEAMALLRALRAGKPLDAAMAPPPVKPGASL